MNKEIIKRNFSKCAKFYDKYSNIQNLGALKLISNIRKNSFTNILEIGCGTGNYTKLLTQKFPKAEIKAIDISPDMIQVAKTKLVNENVKFIIQDAEEITSVRKGLIFSNPLNIYREKFDLITSNSTFQWFENLYQTLLKYNQLLTPNGLVLFSTFGPHTLFELRRSLNKKLKKLKLAPSNFLTKVRIKKILNLLFKEVKVEQEFFQEKYSSLFQLLKKIKFTGVRGTPHYKKGFWTPNMVKQLEKIYKKEFNHIIATYQIFFCKGVTKI